MSLFDRAPYEWQIGWRYTRAGRTGRRNRFISFISGISMLGIALINTMGSLGGFVGPYAVGFIRDATGSFQGGMLFLAGLLVLAGIGTLTLRRAALLRED